MGASSCCPRKATFFIRLSSEYHAGIGIVGFAECVPEIHKQEA